MTTMIKPTYMTLDIWQAAWLHLLDIPLERVTINASGRTEWIFDNADDKAWTNGRDFRTAGVAVAPVLDVRQAYRYMAHLAEEARRERVHNGNDI